MMNTYYDTRQQSDSLWYIVGSMDGENWYYLYEDMFSFPTQPEARAWLIAEGYTNREMGERIQKAVQNNVKFYDGILSADEIKVHYEQSVASGTVFHDLSGHGYDAELRRERHP